MKEEFIHKYEHTLLNIYEKKDLKNCDFDYILVLNNQDKAEIKDNILYINYLDFYQHDYLRYPIPAIRKPNKLLTYHEGIEIMQRVNYGSLAIKSEIPYCTSLNHFIVDEHIYFHCGRQGLKLSGLNQLACYNVVEDLGIHLEAFTNNHNSVHVYGFLKEVTKNKKTLLEAFLQRYTPGFTKNLTDVVINGTMLLELEIIHMNVKKHYH